MYSRVIKKQEDGFAMLANTAISAADVTKAELQAYLKTFDQNKSLRSQFFEHKEVRQLREFINALEPRTLDKAERDQLGLMVFHASTDTKITNFYSVVCNSERATEVLLSAFRKKIPRI